jgi:predicted amidohydrolase YtcJ
MNLLRASAFLMTLLASAGFAADVPAQTLVSAKAIYTMDASQKQVQAFVFDSDGALLALGELEELAQRYPDAVRQDFPEHTIIPGLIDAHGHLLNLGQFLQDVDLLATKSKAEVIARLQQRASELPADAWLLGRGWDQNDWPKAEFPTASDLDAAFPDRPVWLERVDGHAGWANSIALKRATRALDGDWQVTGGEIRRDAKGRASGVLIDAAMQFVQAAVPALDDAARARLLRRATKEAVRFGLTGVHDAGTDLASYRALEQMASAGDLPLRVYAMADGDNAAVATLCAGPVDGATSARWRHSSGRLQMRAVKLYIDGALGSRGAALLKPYSDEPNNSGLLFETAEQLQAKIARARSCGLQVAVHAIGDRGNRVVLDAFAAAGAQSAERHRIEHAQVIHPDDFARFKQIGLIASVQPTHATSDMPWAQARIGALRVRGAYAWQSLRANQVPLALGSDFPVEAVNPMLGLYAAISRADLSGKPEKGWLPAQKLSREEALYGFTVGAAHAGFMEREVGSLVVGKRADFVVLNGDPMQVKPIDIAKLRVLRTVVDGRVSYAAD